MSRYAEYEALEPGCLKLTKAVRNAYWYFHQKWDDVESIFQEFVTVDHMNVNDQHNEGARNCLLALELSNIIHFMTGKGLRHHVEEFWTQSAAARDDEQHP